MPKIKTPKSTKELPQVFITQMLALATSGFSLVAALAWNEVVKEGVNSFIKPYLPEGSTFISLLLYAIIVTALAVSVTLQLTKIQSFLNSNNKKKLK